jgi:hypothetical protein
MAEQHPLPIRHTPENPLLVDRWFARLPISRGWAIAFIGVFFLLVPALLAYWSDVTDISTLIANYRAQFLYALFLVYVLLTSPILERGGERVVWALRLVTQLNDDAFQVVVDRASTVSSAKELLAFGVGMAVGLAINVLFEPLQENPTVLDIYAYWSRVGVFGVIGWVFYTLPFSIRVTNALLKQPIAIDPFDLAPFEPIGRQSLLLAMTVLGGAVLSLLSASVYNQSLWIEYLFVYGAGVICIFVLFFWSMRSVHQLLAISKRKHLDRVERNIASAYATLQRNIAEHEETLTVATELNALVAAKEQLRETRTWPFNTGTLSTLSVAVLTPLFVGLARFLAMFLGQ